MAKKFYTVYTRWVAYELKKNGFEIISIEPNPNKPQFNCYIFEDTPAFQKAMRELNSLKEN